MPTTLKKIIHFQIPIRNGIKNELLITPAQVDMYMKEIERKLREAGVLEEYILIVSPMIPSVCDETVFYNLKVNDITTDDLLNILGRDK